MFLCGSGVAIEGQEGASALGATGGGGAEMMFEKNDIKKKMLPLLWLNLDQKRN